MYHLDHPNTDRSVMKSVANSPAWAHVESDVDPFFGVEKRNMRFGLALDGINPFCHNNTQHSTWPILILLYNLPPYLVTKKFFIQLCILISGKEAPTSDSIDVFLQPLIEELQTLWIGIRAQDFSKPPGKKGFHLRGILIWTIADYLAYGLISGLCTHGKKGCTVCGPETDSRTAMTGNKFNAERRAKGSKVVFGGGRRWLRKHHPYRSNLQFNGEIEDRAAPVRMCARKTIRCTLERRRYLNNGG
jgi:hypothetical protein